MTADRLERARQKVLEALYATYADGVEGLPVAELVAYVRFKDHLFDKGMEAQSAAKAIYVIRRVQGEIEEAFMEVVFAAIEVLQYESMLVYDEHGTVFITHNGIREVEGSK